MGYSIGLISTVCIWCSKKVYLLLLLTLTFKLNNQIYTLGIFYIIIHVYILSMLDRFTIYIFKVFWTGLLFIYFVHVTGTVFDLI